MEMNLLDVNMAALELEMTWFSEELNRRISAYFQQEKPKDDLSLLSPPDLSEDQSNYATLVRHFGFGIKERMVLILALTPHLKPNLLDIFFTKNTMFDRPFTEFGGYVAKNHPGFIPTGETVDFILSGGDVKQRYETIELLRPGHVFGRHDILKLEKADRHEPFLSGILTISDEYLSFLTTGDQFIPDNNELFPAKRISTEMEWEDLVLAPNVIHEIKQINTWIEHEEDLMSLADFRKHVKPGYRSLFYGPPGTGKTLTACLLGKSSGLDVFRVDLSLIVSKYIGETEKNLSKIFDYAEKRRWILFFDEADAIFGKRTQTSSSNDRFANQEVSYLLQRVEDFPGVVILASNLKSNIDEAFSRRFQSIIYFPMPDKFQRLKLWEKLYGGVIKLDPACDLKVLAEKYELSGGSMINVFRYSTLRSIEKNTPMIQHDDVIQGIRKEFRKYGKTI
ncbi:MAG: ATP-binding protein [Bacteroidota bacterium]